MFCFKKSMHLNRGFKRTFGELHMVSFTLLISCRFFIKSAGHQLID